MNLFYIMNQNKIISSCYICKFPPFYNIIHVLFDFSSHVLLWMTLNKLEKKEVRTTYKCDMIRENSFKSLNEGGRVFIPQRLFRAK